MALKISDLAKTPPVSTVETSIGQLSLFSLKVGTTRDLRKSFPDSISEAKPNDYVKTLFTYLYYPSDELKEGKYRPDNRVLSLSDIEELAVTDLANLADTFLQHHKYLYVDGDTDDIKHPRGTDESTIEYIHRLLSLQDEQYRKKLESAFSIGNFSPEVGGKVSDSIKRASEIAATFKKAKEETVKPIILESTYSLPDVSEIHRVQEEIRREPFNELGKRLDSLVDVSREAMDYTADSQKIQLQIANEIKAGGETTDRHAKINIGLTLLVITLTIGIALWSSLSGITFSSEQQKLMDGYSSSIVSSLDLLNANLEKKNSAIDIMKAELEEFKAREHSYQQRIASLESELSVLKAQYEKNLLRKSTQPPLNASQ
tara:strand:+ start:279 stop:1397 length:1119 start_codon:yes stop_codon:yes gene_type:complete